MIMITPQQYYQEHEDSFENVINTRHILVETRKQAEEILERIHKGEGFRELAREYSLCPSGKESGGELGFWPDGTAVPPYEEAAHSLENIGDISGPVQSQFGFHIIQLLGRKEKLALEECQELVQMLADAENKKNPPRCPKKEHSEEWFGHRVEDPYYWLRDARDPETLAWVAEENAYTDLWFDKKELAEKIDVLKAEKLEPVWQDIYPWADGYAAVKMEEGKAEIYRLNERFEVQERLFEEKIDTNYKEYLAIPCPVNPDYLLVQGLYDGDARCTPLVMEYPSKKILKRIGNTFFAGWSDKEPVIYVPDTIADPKTQESRIQVKACNIESGEEKVIVTADGVIGEIKKSSDGRHMIFEIWKDYTVSYFYSYDEAEGTLTDITGGKAVQMKYADSIGDTYYFVCKEYKSTGEIVAVADKYTLKEARTVLAADEGTLEASFAIGENLFILVTEKVCYRLAQVKNGKMKEIRLPGDMGTVTIAGRTDRNVFLKYESFVEKPMLLSFDGIEMDVIEKSGEDAPEEVMVEQRWAHSAEDGKEIPYFMVRRRDADMDGECPTWIYAYGGYNCSMYPGSKEMIANLDIVSWVMKGGIYVLANIRGGGEFGAKWHEEGMGMRKKNCYYDFIGVTEQLIAEQWAKPERIVISGCSNGGLLMSALVTMRPDLFGCVIDSVPHTDMIHFAEDDRGPMYITEYGNPRESKEYFEYMQSYSPYHNIKETNYPAVYIQTGECDNNVPPYHGKKFAAKMQELNQSSNPILLRVLEKGAHDRGSGSVYWQTIAEMQLFAEKALKL